MLKILRKYSGVILFYLAIIVMLILIDIRFTSLNEPSEINKIGIVNE